MKAIVCTKYGSPDVLQFREVEKPAPTDNDWLVRIYATTVTFGDSRLRSFKEMGRYWIFMRLWFGLFKPINNILGHELAGEVESVGNNVTRFRTVIKFSHLQVLEEVLMLSNSVCQKTAWWR